ncbi:hypothetical protein HYH03_016921 [Edaphochlamys debaryana]|uniref:Uncharacterized protein n=1 Tax=Edaphochlamys debaryana TaxID=47281 RepID=A0A835XGN0_9CHLO|nr:hypothetical protein HYH03_016921 [Edaphochlamys debaryana]|eukprot:KAG2484277.1 hypothetical protein HYH03_016921 [Edaphochlamys debaryana]
MPTASKGPLPFAWRDVQLLASELVRPASNTNDAGAAGSTRGAAAQPQQQPRLLSCWDNAMAYAGQFGGGVVFGETLNTPRLKEALALALDTMPFFAGRLTFLQDGRLDLALNGAGARFVAASTATTLPELQEALRTRPYPRYPCGPGPWAPMWPPHDVAALVRDQWPMAAGYVLHLSGGGSALWVAANHVMADFESLQTLAAHWSAAYNHLCRLTANGQPSQSSTVKKAPGGGHGPAGTQAPRPVYEELVEPARRGPVPIGADALEGMAAGEEEQAAAAAAGTPVRRPEVAEAKWWSGLALGAYVWYHLFRRGGGVEVRSAAIPAARLAQLKAAATADLAAPAPGTAVRAGAAPRPAAAPAAAAAAASGSAAAGPAAGAAPVAWVSTNDALLGRLMQVLHSLPTRRGTPLAAFFAADMRRRLRPALPPALLGNVFYSARAEGLRPGEQGLGQVAASVRQALGHLEPQFRAALTRTAAALARVGPCRLVFAFCLERQAQENIFAPEGPLNTTRWDVDFRLWQFGPSPLLAFLPAANLAASVILMHPEPPPPEGSSERGKAGPAGGARAEDLVLHCCMHRVLWAELDETGKDLAAAL